ncbi:MAG: HIT domain-containing protein [Candidatus Nomurabacteria bacterium]|jgi:histidine triad (HIT) family protein|nr:HIT domain-containing protein [Candidatus Nomurabacteria bacterium]
MQEDSIFTKIIKGEIPSYKIYEDDKTLAFLDIQPETAGHTLVVPKIQVDKIYDLPDDYYGALWTTVKKVAANLERVSGQRSLIKVIGTDVPHSHVHVFSLDPNRPAETDPPMADPEELAKQAAKFVLK